MLDVRPWRAPDGTHVLHVHDVAGQDHILTTLTGKDLFDAMERVRGR